MPFHEKTTNELATLTSNSLLSVSVSFSYHSCKHSKCQTGQFMNRKKVKLFERGKRQTSFFSKSKTRVWAFVLELLLILKRRGNKFKWHGLVANARKKHRIWGGWLYVVFSMLIIFTLSRKIPLDLTILLDHLWGLAHNDGHHSKREDEKQSSNHDTWNMTQILTLNSISLPQEFGCQTRWIFSLFTLSKNEWMHCMHRILYICTYLKVYMYVVTSRHYTQTGSSWKSNLTLLSSCVCSSGPLTHFCSLWVTDPAKISHATHIIQWTESHSPNGSTDTRPTWHFPWVNTVHALNSSYFWDLFPLEILEARTGWV